MKFGIGVLLLVTAFGCKDTYTRSAVQNLEDRDPAALERAAIGPWLASGDQLPEIEALLDNALRAEYSAGLRTADDHERVVHAASIEWVRQVRRHLGRDNLKTTVRALADDRDCTGSVTENAVLLDYVEATFGREPSTERVVAALHGLAKQMACLEQSQATTLAAAMKLAFDDVVTSLRINALDGAIPYVAQAVSSAMLLVHDVERRHGEDAPLSRWFREYEAALVDGARRLHHPANWHGLWLYDRITGRLRGFRVVDKAFDENTVALEALFHTIATPTLEDLRCSLVEMIQRGPSKYDRYECLGARCASGDAEACATAGGGGDDPAEHGGTVDIPGMTSSAAIDCVTTQAAHSSSREQLTCLMEATGRGASPLDAITKQITSVPLGGIKGNCDRGQIDAASLADATYNTHVKRAEERYQQALATALSDLTNAIDELAQRQRERGALDGTNASAADIAAADAEVDKAEEKVNQRAKDAADAAQKAAEQRAKDIKAAEEQRKKDQAAAGSGSGSCGGSGGGSDGGSGGSGAGSDDGAGSGAGSDDEQCVDSESCGCTALSAQAQAMLDCVTGEGKPEWSDPLVGPGGCGGVCDPIDPESTAIDNSCFTELSLDDGAAVSQACWAVRCGPADQGSSACCGGASLANGTPTQMTGACGDVDCADGVQPTFAGGACTCGNSGAGIPSGAMVPSTGPNPYFPFDF